MEPGLPPSQLSQFLSLSLHLAFKFQKMHLEHDSLVPNMAIYMKRQNSFFCINSDQIYNFIIMHLVLNEITLNIFGVEYH